MRKALTVLVLIPCLLFSVAGKKDKKKKGKGEEVAAVGWTDVGGGQCFAPADFSKLAIGPRRIARSDAIVSMIEQWRGERGDGVSMDERLVMTLETILLGDPEDVEKIASANFENCKKHFAGGSGWNTWLATLPPMLTAGECRGSLLPQQMHDYLSLSAGWHMKMPFCKGERILIEATDKDFYRVDERGPWITVDGDPDGSLDNVISKDAKRGQLLLRFTSDDGSIQVVQPAGVQTVFTAPAHGKLEVRINDKSPADNIWKVEAGMSHHTGVTYRSAD